MPLSTNSGTDALAQKATRPDLREILFDGFRFISKNYEIIQRSAFHIYQSALPFTPMKTLLHNVFIKDNLLQLGGGPERWDALISTTRCEGLSHRITFSMDNLHFASRDEEGVHLWDATSGTPVKSFKGDRLVLSSDFSVVALSKDRAVTLYNVTSNAPIADCYISSTEIAELALSFDGSRMAVGFGDGTVGLWDSREKGGFIAGFGGYACKDGQLEFSPRGYHLAFLSYGGDIQLSNGFNGGFIARMSYNSEQLSKFVFSHSGSRLAALTTKYTGGLLADRDLTLWNCENGEIVGVATDVRNVLAISNDGSLIATGGWRKGVVQLWSGNSGRIAVCVGENKNKNKNKNEKGKWEPLASPGYRSANHQRWFDR